MDFGFGHDTKNKRTPEEALASFELAFVHKATALVPAHCSKPPDVILRICVLILHVLQHLRKKYAQNAQHKRSANTPHIHKGVGPESAAINQQSYELPRSVSAASLSSMPSDSLTLDRFVRMRRSRLSRSACGAASSAGTPPGPGSCCCTLLSERGHRNERIH